MYCEDLGVFSYFRWDSAAFTRSCLLSVSHAPSLICSRFHLLSYALVCFHSLSLALVCSGSHSRTYTHGLDFFTILTASYYGLHSAYSDELVLFYYLCAASGILGGKHGMIDGPAYWQPYWPYWQPLLTLLTSRSHKKEWLLPWLCLHTPVTS